MSATWSEGDWNGDGLFDQKDIVAALQMGKYLQGPYEALSGWVGTGDGHVTIVYNAVTGEVAAEVPGTELTVINITSSAGVFTGPGQRDLAERGILDNKDEHIWMANLGTSFGSFSFGNVAQTGLSEDFLINELTVFGALSGGGGIGAVDLRYIPEPSTLVLLSLGICIVTFGRRRRGA
jgi:hypothetical protein